MTARFVSDVSLHVAPGLLGVPLASPTRRLVAFVLDWAILMIPSIAVAVGAAALTLWMSDRRTFDALRTLWSEETTVPQATHRARRDSVRLLVRVEAPGLPPAAVLAVQEGRLDDAAEAISHRRFLWSLRMGEPLYETPLPEGSIRVPVERMIPAGVRAFALFGVPAVYFSVLTSRFGRTLGKRLVGIRGGRLDGHQVSLLEAFERFTGHLHIPALLGWPVLDLWRDPNRQLPHDRAARTFVLRAKRRKSRAATAATADAIPSGGGREEAPPDSASSTQ